MGDHIRVTDVAPRDGLQNEPGVIAPADKAALINALLSTGVDEVEITSFVSPKWIPQLGDAAEVLRLVGDGPPGSERVVCSALVPNDKGMQRALESIDAGARLDKVSVFAAASETFSRKNTNASIAETLERFVPVLEMARDRGLPVRGYVSCAIACPFEGPIPPGAVADVAARLAAIGVAEVDLGDTIGAGEPATVEAMLDAVASEISEGTVVTLHLHDTYGRAADCVRAALQRGIRSFDSAAGGLGGCPYASTEGARAPGNISTIALLQVIEDEGFATTVGRDAMLEASQLAESMRSGAS